MIQLKGWILSKGSLKHKKKSGGKTAAPISH